MNISLNKKTKKSNKHAKQTNFRVWVRDDRERDYREKDLPLSLGERIKILKHSLFCTRSLCKSVQVREMQMSCQPACEKVRQRPSAKINDLDKRASQCTYHSVWPSTAKHVLEWNFPKKKNNLRVSTALGFGNEIVSQKRSSKPGLIKAVLRKNRLENLPKSWLNNKHKYCWHDPGAALGGFCWMFAWGLPLSLASPCHKLHT